MKRFYWQILAQFRGPLLQFLFFLALAFDINAQFAFVTNNGTITITGYGGPAGAVVIPDTTNGLPVTCIRKYAFYQNANITSLNVPDTVSSLETYALGYCMNLTNITLGTGLTNIGTYTFFHCTNLSSAVIPTNVTSLGAFVFGVCSNLTTLRIPNSVTNIGDGAISYCTSLAILELPEHLTTIGTMAFFNSFRLTGIAMPTNVATIGDAAFQGCGSLTNVNIPQSVTNIGWQVFSFCSNLRSISVDAGNSLYSSLEGVLFNRSKNVLIQYPSGKLGPYTVPSTVTNILAYAFLTDVTNLAHIYFEGNAPSIGEYAFSGDTNMTVYYLPTTTGWTSTFGGRPAVLWNPQFQTAGSTFGVVSNQFGFTITGTPNIPILLETTTTLANPSWTTLENCNLTNGALHFTDTNGLHFSSRFYRIRSP